jgi:hypothetical protein
MCVHAIQKGNGLSALATAETASLNIMLGAMLLRSLPVTRQCHRVWLTSCSQGTSRHDEHVVILGVAIGAKGSFAIMSMKTELSSRQCTRSSVTYCMVLFLE